MQLLETASLSPIHATDEQEKYMELSAVLTAAPEGGYVAFNPETGTTTQGETVEEALGNLREATELYLEEFPAIITSRPFLTTFEVAPHAS
jgi:predicted RNase H-like HicB family nuclease